MPELEDLDDDPTPAVGGDPDPAPKAGDPPADGSDDDAADDLAVEVQHDGKTVKMAPVSTLIKHRQASRTARERTATVERENEELKAKLAKVNGDVEKLSPLLQRLHARPDLVEAAMKGTKPSAAGNPANDDADPEMVELAKMFEFYDAEGKPDAARAARVSGHFEKRADAKAEAKVAPLVHQQVQNRADANKATLYRWAEEGHITKQGVEQALAMMPGADQLLAHDGVRDVLYFIAKGMSPAQAKAAVAKEGGDLGDEPIHIERPGGRGKVPADLPKFSQRNAAQRGRTSAEWSKLRDQDSDVLE